MLVGIHFCGLTLSCNWDIQIYTPYPLRHSWRLTVTTLHFADECEFSGLVKQENHFDLSLKALINAMIQFHQKQSTFWEQKILKAAKRTADDLLATESHPLPEEHVHNIPAPMVALVYGAYINFHNNVQAMSGAPEWRLTSSNHFVRFSSWEGS